MPDDPIATAPKSEVHTFTVSAPAPDIEQSIAVLTQEIQADPEKAARKMKELRQEAAERRVEARELKKAREALSEKEAAEKARAEKALADQGEFKALAEARAAELAKAQAELASATAYRTALEAILAARIAALSDADKRLVPDFGDPIRTLQWLEANADRFAPVTLPTTNPGNAPAPLDAARVRKDQYLAGRGKAKM